MVGARTGSGGQQRSLDSGYSGKVEPTGQMIELDLECGDKIKGHVSLLGLNIWKLAVPLTEKGPEGATGLWGKSKLLLCLNRLSLRCPLGLPMGRTNGQLDTQV